MPQVTSKNADKTQGTYKNINLLVERGRNKLSVTLYRARRVQHDGSEHSQGTCSTNEQNSRGPYPTKINIGGH